MTENTRAVVQVRLTARDKKRVEAPAASEHVTVSEFVRQAIWRDLGEEGGSDSESAAPGRGRVERSEEGDGRT